MKTYPLNSISIEDATKKQFRMVDEITKEFKGEESLSLGDLGVVKGLNRPVATSKAERVIANFFEAEEAVLVRGSGTGAIRSAIHSVVRPGESILVHDAPIYPTTKVILETSGILCEKVDYNNVQQLNDALDKTECKVALVQLTRQQIGDSYDYKEVIKTIKKKGLVVITDDNYAVMKVDRIGVEVGGDISCFSSFKLLGPQGVGVVVGKKEYLDKILKNNYSGGSQVQGFESQEVLRGLVFAPVLLAVQSEVNNNLVKRLCNGEVSGVKNAFLANAQSKVLIVELEKPIAMEVIAQAEKMGALPNPVGAESKYEIAPMVYRVSGTFLLSDPKLGSYMVRINPNRAGEETIMRILRESIKKATE